MLLTLFATLLTMTFNTLICHVLLERRKSVPYCICAFIFFSTGISLLIAATLLIIGRTPLAKYVYLVLNCCYIFYIQLVFTESFPKKLFTMFSAWILTNIILLLCVFIIDTFYYHKIYIFVYLHCRHSPPVYSINHTITCIYFSSEQL